MPIAPVDPLKKPVAPQVGVAGASPLPAKVGVAVKPPVPADGGNRDATMSWLKGLPDVNPGAAHPQQLAPWALDQVHSAGKNPADFRMVGQGLAPASPGVAGAPRSPGQPGIQSATSIPSRAASGDPYLDALHKEFTRANGEYASRIAPHPTTVYPDSSGSPSTVMMRGSGDFNPVARQIDMIQQYNQNKAKTAEMDPMSAVKVLEGITRSPTASAAYYGGKGKPVPAVPQGTEGKPLDPNGYAQVLAKPENSGMAALLGDQNLDFQDRLQKASHFEGMADANHPNHQLMQNWMNEHYLDPKTWNEDTYVPTNPDTTTLSAINPLVNRYAGLMGAIGSAVDPTGLTGETSAGTGLNWRENYAKRSRGLELLQKLGLVPPNGGEMPYQP